MPVDHPVDFKLCTMMPWITTPIVSTEVNRDLIEYGGFVVGFSGLFFVLIGIVRNLQL